MRCEFQLPGSRKQGQILALGHSDTVWPLGTLKTMPFRQARGRLWGPGVLDMKAGLVFFAFAMRILRELDVPVRRKVVLQVNSDEEVGSPSSRLLTEEIAKKRRRAGARTRHGTRRKAEDRPQRRRRLPDHGSRARRARRSRFRKGRERGGRDGPADRAHRGLHAPGSRNHRQPGRDPGRHAQQRRARRVPRRGRRARAERSRPAISGTAVCIAESRSTSAVRSKSRAA